LEGVWGKPSTSDADDVAEGRIMLRKSGAQLAAMVNLPKPDDTRGKLKN